MVLMPCRECGDRMSSEAESCPHCGAPNVFLRDVANETEGGGPSEPIGSTERVKRVALRSGAWVLGVLLGLMSLTAMFSGSLLSACGLAILAACVLPPVVDRINWTARVRKAAALVGVAFFAVGTLTSPIESSSTNGKSDAAAARDSVAKAELAKQDSLYREKADSIKAAIVRAVQSGSDKQALSIITEWRRASHGDLDSLFNSIRERQVLHEVRQVPATDLETNIRMYRELTKLAPDNASYKEKLEHYSLQQRLAAKWSYNSSTDEMSGRTTRTASIRSENTVNFDFPYQGPQRATLTLRTHPSYGRDAIFRIEKGQILCTTYSRCRVRVRFDDSGPVTWGANPAADNSTEVIFLQAYGGFVSRLQRSKVIRIQPEVYQEGNPIFEFQVGGFDPVRYADR